ncbi:MAG: glycosyltransferase N-terminal domain-containing protein [Bacteroidota bacterium]
MLLYRIGIWLYHALLLLASPFHAKARLWVRGRKGQLDRIRPQIVSSKPRLWMHCASVGEFEQGRPLLERWRQQHPDWQLVLSFFSPSGYELRKSHSQVDVVCYLPLDTPRRARAFLNCIQPTIALMVKNEFWFCHLRELQTRRIPIVLLSAVFRPDQLFFRWYGRSFLPDLAAYRLLFVQDEASRKLLRQHGIEHAKVVGDSRVDRVLEIAREAPRLPLVEGFVKRHPTLVIGSSWPPDEHLLEPLISTHPDWKFIFAPHEISEGQLQRLEQQVRLPSIRYSKLQVGVESDASVLIIDNIGMLAGLYRYGSMAYVGGGFGQGIHNLLEPAAHGLAVIFGPRHHKFREATLLLERGAGFCVTDAASLGRVFQELQDVEKRQEAGLRALGLMQEQAGASQIIYEDLLSLLSKK